MIRELFYDRTTVARNPLNLIGFLFPEFYDVLQFFVGSLVIILFYCALRNDENQLAMQIEAKEPAVTTDKQTELSSIQRTDTAVFPQTISKIIQRSSFDERTIDIRMENESQAEPVLGTTKEKECWHLYRRMCDKGVCVSFDTVLRGMLTPTEYRLRRREIT
ncbi:hypothetical protein KQX54_015977 [Cotesia glomerata]|uniref:Uncharacterized protein n=1 Tax=Cotesia glomerata TaxID=32391 RepID=A0AAV7HW26_COTGL|nr:hypothetical protein KQX54_015977 [Cotesia glomerata]